MNELNQNPLPPRLLPQVTALAVIILLIVAVYSNSFQTPFIFDDLDNFSLDPSMQMTSVSWGNLKKAASGLLSKRWLPNLSYAFNYYFGKDRVWGYHFFNVVIHILAALSFYWLSFTTLRLPRFSCRETAARNIALAAALIWALHPLQTNSVTYIVQRMTSMAALFFFLSLLFYIKGRTSGRLSARLLFFSGSLLSAALAFSSKENAATLPLIILACEFFFLAGPGRKLDRRKLLLAGGTILLVVGLGLIYTNGRILEIITSGYGSRDFDMSQRLLTQTRIILLYISLLTLPLPSRLNLCHDINISTGFFSPPATGLAILAIAGISLLIPLLYKRNRLLSFGVFWFLATQVIESSIIPLELIFEHRLYLPSAMPILAVTAFVSPYLSVKTARIASISIVAGLCLLTWQRNNVWSSDISLWSDVVAKSPNLGRGYDYLGRAYLSANNPQKAYQLFQAANSRGVKAVYYNNWGKAAFELDKVDEAIAHFLEAVRLNPQHPQAHHNLGVAYGSKGLYDEARREMLIGMRLQGGRLN